MGVMRFDIAVKEDVGKLFRMKVIESKEIRQAH